MKSILLIDDDISILETLKIFFSSNNFNVDTACSGETGIDLFDKKFFDIIITDLNMPMGMDGFEVIRLIKEKKSSTPVLVLTGFDDMHSIIKAMKIGAYDYIEKPIDLNKVKEIVDKALNLNSLSHNCNDMLFVNDTEFIKYNLIGKTEKMKEIFKIIGQVCGNRITVHIKGESGTGKELVAHLIHNSGITKDFPFVAVNCTALTETLLESELFGHIRGSFTGAIKDKKGKFELAGLGTIFLDEISDISNDLQIKLLRILEEKEFEPVGSNQTIPIKARIITATNKDLSKLVKEGKFREDLFYRLNVFNIELPPLRERTEDIPLLVVEFLKKINFELHTNVRKVPYEVMQMLQSHNWVGNVRELYNIILQAVVLAKGDVLEKENLFLKKFNPDNGNESDKLLSLDEMEKIHINKVLNECKWNKLKSCKILKISKPTLNSKILKYSLRP